jgi:hypothetical protein
MLKIFSIQNAFTGFPSNICIPQSPLFPRVQPPPPILFSSIFMFLPLKADLLESL